MYASFEGFQIQNIKITQIFSEFTDSIDTFDFPERVGTDDFWPEGETFCENLNKRKIYFYPHCYVPKLIFSLQPVAALRATILGGLLEEHPDSTGDFVCFLCVFCLFVFCLSPKIVQQLITAAYNGSL